MAFKSKEIYKEFEDIVGPENICDDPAIMPAYFNTDFAAVVLPKNTEEVASMVKLCNKHKVMFRPICTGWSGSFPKDAVLLDLRRMNRIIEINEKNMYAVVEPYVISAELQAECMKRGLNFSIKGAGANCAALLRGHGHMDQTTSGDDRNHLAIEWVTPEGNIVHTGALGSSGDWFCGDGPGPSMRSILTSAVPPGVTPGVFTKAAVKLYHWPGPAAWPMVGHSNKYVMEKIPANMMGRYYSFPSIEKMWAAELALGENEVCYELMGFNVAMVAANITTCNEEDAAMFTKLNKETQGPGFFVIIAGNSAEDFEWKKKTLEKIVKDNGGKSLKSVEDPEVEGIMLAHNTRICASIRETFRPGGAFTSIPIMGQRDLTIKWAIGAGKAKLPLIKKGYIVDDGGAFFGWGVEQGQLGKTEIFCKYSPAYTEAKNAVDEWKKTQNRRAFEEKYFAGTIDAGDDVSREMCNFLDIWRKLIKTIDPNGVSPEGGSLV
jgi:glycolate oxidase